MEHLNDHTTLEKLRQQAEEFDKRGPRAMVVGPKGVGKSDLCRRLLNCAVHVGRTPLYVETDVGQGILSIPGTISSVLIEQHVAQEEGLLQTTPLIYHFGYISPSENSTLYKAVVNELAYVTLNSMKRNKRSKYSGIIINTCGWVKGTGYDCLIHISQAFQVNVIFVLDEGLYNKLLGDMPSFINVVLSTKSAPVEKRGKEIRSDCRDQRIKQYFYGSKTNLHPISVEIKFASLKLFTINRNANMVTVTPSQSILHHILAVILAKTTEVNVIGKNVAGFVCVTGVNMERETIRVLSPQSCSLSNKLFLLSQVQFRDSYKI